MAREQFTFYRSFWEAAKRIKKPGDRLSFLEAIIAFGIDEEERDTTDAVASNFLLVKPTLISSAKKAKAGKKGGSAKQTGSKPEASGKQPGREKEGENKKEGEGEIEVEDECHNTPTSASAAPKALTYFMERINPAPSSVLTREFLEFIDALGDDVVLHALHIAVDERKTSWSYIRAILNRYKSDGLLDLPAVLDAEERHRQQKGGKRSGNVFADLVQEGRLDEPC